MSDKAAADLAVAAIIIGWLVVVAALVIEGHPFFALLVMICAPSSPETKSES